MARAECAYSEAAATPWAAPPMYKLVLFCFSSLLLSLSFALPTFLSLYNFFSFWILKTITRFLQLLLSGAALSFSQYLNLCCPCGLCWWIEESGSSDVVGFCRLDLLILTPIPLSNPSTPAGCWRHYLPGNNISYEQQLTNTPSLVIFLRALPLPMYKSLTHHGECLYTTEFGDLNYMKRAHRSPKLVSSSSIALETLSLASFPLQPGFAMWLGPDQQGANGSTRW